MGRQDIKVKTSSFTYKVLIGEGLLAETGEAVRRISPGDRLLLISDTTVYKIYGQQIQRALEAGKWQVETAMIKPGERSKSLAGAARLYNQAIEAGLDRHCPFVALGGGVVGDLAGFAAATYLRGVPLVMVPTTLLAQVDSGVGGKVAVNHPAGKNLIGAIYPPRLVITDPGVLNTLPYRQLAAGLAEVIKYGIIGDKTFFACLERDLGRMLNKESLPLSNAVARSIAAKAEVVEKDEFEKDYRQVLNFGHTIGHALEAATEYRHYLHGEAVAVGMVAATMLSRSLKMIEAGAAGRILRLLGRLGLKQPPPGLTGEAVTDKLRQDKKRRDGKTVFILPTAVGRVSILEVNDNQLIGRVIEACLRNEINLQ
ncbi:MAG TPA: 3-dehydroquinate synthase [Firmicutes bacterium]|nr:3-dehydroquinate synthase [Bacillota bacterium]